jgi:hypothetical protein
MVWALLLFDLMKGDWVGDGERVQRLSGHRTQIQVESHASIDGTRLLSANRIVEKADAGTREYRRSYWIRPAAAANHYELGAGDTVSSEGTFEGNQFVVTQALGGWTVRTETTFVGTDRSETHEVFSDEHGPVSDTWIHYRKAP